MRDIKRRRASVESTGQITKAMKLVSTVKLQRAKERALCSKTYYHSMYLTVKNLLSKAGSVDSVYTKVPETNRKAVIVITSNRGLAGGYNSNVVKTILQSDLKKEDLDIYAIGKKGKELLERRGYHIEEELSDLMEEFEYADTIKLCDRIMRRFERGEIGEIYIAYTFFKNTVSHVPMLVKLTAVASRSSTIPT